MRASASESARLDAVLLLADAVGTGRVSVMAHDDAVVGEGAAARFRAAIERRAAGERRHIRGLKEFYGLAYQVDRRALIPRPETERLVEFAVKAVVGGLRVGRGDADASLSVVDVGTGSGAMAMASLSSSGSVAHPTLSPSSRPIVRLSPSTLPMRMRSATRWPTGSRSSRRMCCLRKDQTPDRSTSFWRVGRTFGMTRWHIFPVATSSSR